MGFYTFFVVENVQCNSIWDSSLNYPKVFVIFIILLNEGIVNLFKMYVVLLTNLVDVEFLQNCDVAYR